MTTTAPPPVARHEYNALTAVPGYVFRLSQLTPRCQQVAEMLVLGKTPAAIGEALGIRPDTVRNHTKACYERTGTRNRGELVAWLLLNIRPTTKDEP